MALVKTAIGISALLLWTAKKIAPWIEGNV